VRTLAVPAVGTGIAGFPIDECAAVMAGCLLELKTLGREPEEVRFVLFDDAARLAFEQAFWPAWQGSTDAGG